MEPIAVANVQIWRRSCRRWSDSSIRFRRSGKRPGDE
jgi:hypothetical protein